MSAIAPFTAGWATGCTRDATLNPCEVSASQGTGTSAEEIWIPQIYTGVVLGVDFVKVSAPTADPDRDGGLCSERCGFADNPRDYSFEVILTNDGHVSVNDGDPTTAKFERALTAEELAHYLELRYTSPLKELAAARSLTDTSAFCPPTDESRAQYYSAGLGAVNDHGLVIGLGPIQTCFRDLTEPPSGEQQALMALTEWLRVLGRDVVGGCADFAETLSDAGAPVTAPEALNICKFRWDVEAAWQ